MNTPLPESVVAVSNNWATVQAYYACYQAFCALTIARGRPVSKHAAGSQRYAEFWVQPGWHIAPWTVSFGAPGWGNCPTRPVAPKTRLTELVTRRNCWSHFKRCLESTRNDVIELQLERKRAAKERSRGRRMKLNAKEVRETKVSVKPVTLLDYLYRLRTRSNYEDAAMFVDGPSSVAQSLKFNERLREVTSATMMLQERAVAKIIGAQQMRKLADDTLKRISSQGHEFGLHIRRQFF